MLTRLLYRLLRVEPPTAVFLIALVSLLVVGFALTKVPGV